MAVVVSQTLPFDSTALDLENPARWNTLLPLVRPSVKAVQTPKGQQILVDTALAHSPHPHIIAIGSLGHFSSKILDERGFVSAIVTSQAGAGLLTTHDVSHALRQAGFDTAAGVVVVRTGKSRNIESQGADVVEVQTAGEFEADHLLHLLAAATDTCRASVHHTAELVKMFVNAASVAHARFHPEKVGGRPAMAHSAGGHAAFEKAKHAVEREVKHAMQTHAQLEEQLVYSVHYSDINGLSRLENYIMAGEIATYLESQNLPYRLSHSTILDHGEQARGFSISILPVPAQYLSAQPAPQRHAPNATADAAAKKSLQPMTESKMTFEDATVRRRVENGCNAVIATEPTITEYDTIVGDGDCGYTLRDGAKQVLSFISQRDLTQLPTAVADLVSELEVNMGGTSGALYCIYLSALSTSLATEASVPAALKQALQTLCKYTKARVGDRTMMDALIPFIDTLASNGGEAAPALAAAEKGVDGTKKMEAKLGRSTYLDESATRGVPDPGAYGLLVLFEGMSK